MQKLFNDFSEELRKEEYFLKSGGHDFLVVASDFHVEYANIMDPIDAIVFENMTFGYFETTPAISLNIDDEVRYRDRVSSVWLNTHVKWRCNVLVQSGGMRNTGFLFLRALISSPKSENQRIKLFCF